MDDETFSDRKLLQELSTEYDLYSVYNFGKLELEVRSKYRNIANPGFIVLDSNNIEVHRFSGYFESTALLSQLALAHTEDGFSRMEMRFAEEQSDRNFMKQYLIAKESASLLDSSTIMQYLYSLEPLEPFSKELIREILHYGYYKGNIFIDCESILYEGLKNAFHEGRFPDLSRSICNRLIFSLDKCFSVTSDEHRRLDYLNQLEELEHGELIGINILDDSSRFHTIFNEYFPSIGMRHDFYVVEDDSSQLIMLTNIFLKIQDHPNALNQLAWDIYMEEYLFPVDYGIKLVRRALEIKYEYYYLDTYAALLFKRGSYSQAEQIALEAIQLAESTNRDSSDTKQLLKKIQAAK